jgi:murein DD-endopeptidase MepM/ murein hydrolase activator NlpD
VSKHARSPRSPLTERRYLSRAAAVAVLLVAHTSPIETQSASAPESLATGTLAQIFVVGDAIHPAPIIRDTFGATTPPTVLWPVGDNAAISDGFGPREAPCTGCTSNHQGADFNPGQGTPIVAIGAGTVAEVSSSTGGYGESVIVEHEVDGERVSSLYAHMEPGTISVAPGDSVQAGQLIGKVGNTGASTGPHLHLEIRMNGTPTDPIAWLQGKTR